MPKLGCGVHNTGMVSAGRLRLLIVGVIVALFIAGVCFCLLNPHARQLLHEPRTLGRTARVWTGEHPWRAEGALLGLYILLTLSGLPVWWLNVLAGFSFGLIGGTVRCVLDAAIAATVTAQLWRWLAADVAEHTAISRFKILRLLKHYSADGGFLVVLLTRLAHLLPFGLSNDVFGMLGIRWQSVFLGTLIGGIPTVAVYVSLGAGREWQAHWLFVTIIGLLALGGIILGGIIYVRHREAEGAAAGPLPRQNGHAEK